MLYITETRAKGLHLSQHVKTNTGVSLSKIFLVIGIFFCLTLTPGPAFAYIDPGSGSMAYQVLLTGLLAGALAVRRALTWITSWFRTRHHGVEMSDDSEPSA